MYKQKKSMWQKHIDFIILDLLCMQISYILAYVIRHGFDVPYFLDVYLGLEAILLLVQICVNFFTNNYKNILRRNGFEEFKKTFMIVSMVIMLVFVYLFLNKNAEIFSRAMFIQFWCIAIIMIYIERLIWKQVIRRRMENVEFLQNMVVVSEPERVEDTISSMQIRQYNGFRIKGILLENKTIEKQQVLGVPVLGKAEDSGKILKEEVVDEVFLDLPIYSKRVKEIQKNCLEMGITTHLNLGKVTDGESNMIVENYAEHMVLTSSINFADSWQLFLKRAIDVLGGIVGLAITGILVVVFGPIIFLQSPGPIFFFQERVGQSGRRFWICKFRSMYPDAEERKRELMKQNKMQGLMFKMDDDPRIIPIGKFMRRTSLDEFPQFWNVLKGNMSLVGTRPPTVDEYEQYEMHHKARLAAKPGLTGMWQVSGRSDIVDFEEVVRLDKKYIEEWNTGLDLKILLQTVKVVFTGKGSV